ncbi:hypothetical protein [Aerococcus christensenii]|uniref:Uncharacterized protein n=1 Tax=Aerococcus christensenii TaxID=87541 RepID=A0A133XZM1_9LACT|nr:hypothetical protein [Aerococcus christensenii]KXB36362.1 hypothetical protein HMPREF3187_00871 [Aerococcus christensenii]MDK8234178.1 hypothetical protein [Aerococcus christensenii]
MGFRFKSDQQETIEDLFDRIIQPVQPRKEVQTEPQIGEHPLYLISDDFIQSHSAFADFQAFKLAAPIPLTLTPPNEGDLFLLNLFIKEHTDFSSWQKLLDAYHHSLPTH